MSLRFWIEGDRSEALCEVCRGWEQITFMRRSFRLEISRVDVQDVLVGVCDICDTTISLPHQSSRKLKAARVESFEVGSGGVFVDLGIRDAFLMRRKANLAHAILDRLEQGVAMESIPPHDLEKIKNGRIRRMPLRQLEDYLREPSRAKRS